MMFDANIRPLDRHLDYTKMSMDSSLALFEEVLRKLFLLKPW